jgi:hypothetical protein
MTRTLIAIAIALSACKGETKTQIDPKTQTDLDACQKNNDEQKKLIADLQRQNSELQKEKSIAGDIVVSIDGNALVIKRNTATAGYQTIDPKIATAATRQFLDVVEKSRGAIQKCYEQALKKDASLQAHTVTVTIQASFAQTGQNRDSSVSPPINDTFDRCIRTVASKWTVPQNPPVTVFRAPVSLTPS